jgi:hypothetical protein
MPASDAADLPPQRLVELVTVAGSLADEWRAAGVVWPGWRLAGGFFGVHRLAPPPRPRVTSP